MHWKKILSKKLGDGWIDLMKIDRDYVVRVAMYSDDIPHVFQTVPIDEYPCARDAIKEALFWYESYIEVGCGAEGLIECHYSLLEDIEEAEKQEQGQQPQAAE